MVQLQLTERWGWGHSDVYRALKRMHQYFVRSHRLAHAKGLQHVSREFLDGHASGLTGKDIHEYERMIQGRCTPPQQRELRERSVPRAHPRRPKLGAVPYASKTPELCGWAGDGRVPDGTAAGQHVPEPAQDVTDGEEQPRPRSRTGPQEQQQLQRH